MLMKRILTVLTALLFAIIFFVQVLASEELSSEIISLSYKGSNKYMSWDLQIPQVQGLDSARVERSINRHLLKTVKHLKKEVLAEAIKAYRESKKAEYPLRPFEVHVDYKVHALNQKLLSLTMDLYKFTGGAHGFTVRKPFNYDLKSGKELGYKDIFKDCPNYSQVIIHHITDKIIKNPDAYFDDALDKVRQMTDEQPFYITDKGIVVIFGLYEIAPYASGIQEFFVPFSAFKCS